MGFRIADTFSDSLGNLTVQDQNLLKERRLICKWIRPTQDFGFTNRTGKGTYRRQNDAPKRLKHWLGFDDEGNK
ncbi:MAG: hypothetical protein WC247_05605 [Porticoccaceae bacterium]|jgi:hypothetical protein